MSEQKCLKTQIEMAERRLGFLEKQIKKLESIQNRGHLENEDLIKFRCQEANLTKALEWMKYDEKNTDHYHIDIVLPLENQSKEDNAYLC